MQQKGVSMQRLKQLEQKFREEGLVSAKTIKISRQRSSDPEAVEDPVEAEQGVVEEKNEEDPLITYIQSNRKISDEEIKNASKLILEEIDGNLFNY